MNNSTAETLAELRGFFHAFECVNGKTDHGYSFEISVAEPTGDIATDIAAKIVTDTLMSTSLQACDQWRKTLFQTLKRWLLAYLNDRHSIGRLTDASRTFSLSSRSFHKDMIDPIIDQIESIAPVHSAYEITVETEGFYACDYTDLVLVTTGPLVFLHFDVCD